LTPRKKRATSLSSSLIQKRASFNRPETYRHHTVTPSRAYPTTAYAPPPSPLRSRRPVTAITALRRGFASALASLAEVSVAPVASASRSPRTIGLGAFAPTKMASSVMTGAAAALAPTPRGATVRATVNHRGAAASAMRGVRCSNAAAPTPASGASGASRRRSLYCKVLNPHPNPLTLNPKPYSPTGVIGWGCTADCEGVAMCRKETPLTARARCSRTPRN